MDAVAVRNFKRLIVASNNEFPVPRDSDDARFVVLDVSEAHREDWPYFKALREELETGGYGTLMHTLMVADIEGWHPRQIPAALRQRGWDIKLRSAGSTAQWWFECLDQGWIVRSDGISEQARYSWTDKLLADAVRGTYLNWCQKNRVVHVENDRQLGQKLKAWGIVRRRPREKGKEDRPRWYHFPQLDQARKAFGQAFAIPDNAWTDGDEEE